MPSWSQDVSDSSSSEQSSLPPSIKLGADYFPPSLMKETVAPRAENLKLQVSQWDFGITIPNQFKNGNFISHGIEYNQLNIDYLDLDVDLGNLVTKVHSIEYEFIWMKTLNVKWDVMTIFMPGLASEFESDISQDDLILTIAVIGIRKYTERLSIGYGAGYNPNFGTHYPMPIFAMRWNNGKNMKIETIFPVHFSFDYRPNKNFDLGADFRMDGSRYHGNPATYGVKNPQMRYSVTKGGPSITINFLPWLHLKCIGGYTFFRRIEFYDGLEQNGSFDIKQSGFLSLKLIVGDGN